MANRRAVVTIHCIRRLKNTVNGNPRFRVDTDMGSFNTANDSSYAINIDNLQGYLPIRKALTISGRGTIEEVHEP